MTLLTVSVHPAGVALRHSDLAVIVVLSLVFGLLSLPLNKCLFWHYWARSAMWIGITTFMIIQLAAGWFAWYIARHYWAPTHFHYLNDLLLAAALFAVTRTDLTLIGVVETDNSRSILRWIWGRVAAGVDDFTRPRVEQWADALSDQHLVDFSERVATRIRQQGDIGFVAESVLVRIVALLQQVVDTQTIVASDRIELRAFIVQYTISNRIVFGLR